MSQAAFIYVRISEDREGAGLGVERQEKDCRELAERLGYDVAHVYVDNDLSAYSGKPRPSYKEMLIRLEAGEADAVLVWHTDRLHRNPAELESYIDTSEKRKAVTYSVKVGPLDLATPSGRLVARQLGAVARFESEHKSERVKSAYQQRVLDGGYGGGPRPFGFEADGLTVREDEATVIRRASEMVLTGVPLRAIAREPWCTKTSKRLRELLVRPRNAGLAVYGGQEAATLPGKPIVPVDQWRQVARILCDPGRVSNHVSTKASALGSSLYVCGKCGGQMTIGCTGRSGRVRGYHCNEYRHVSCAQAALDEFVEEVIVRRLTEYGGRLLAPKAEDLGPVYAQRETLTGRLDELGAMFAASEVDAVTMRRAGRDLRAGIDQLDKRIASAASRSPLAAVVGQPDVRAAWEAAGLARQRAIMSALVTVTVMPTSRRGRGFDAGRVRFEWRQS